MFSAEQQNRRGRVFELQMKLAGCAEIARIHQVNRLSNSWSIFAKNHVELRALLDLLCNKPEGMEFFFVDNHSMWEQAMHELSRLIHNVVAAGVSVVDHAKSLHGQLHKRSARFPDFQAEADKRMFQRPVAAFMRELRNHFMHIGIPDIGTKFSYSSDWPDFLRQVTIPKRVLRPSDWKLPQARVYLDSVRTDFIDVSQVVDEYRDVVNDFLEWISDRLQHLHRSDYDAVSQYQREILRLRADEIQSELDQRVKVLQRGIGTIRDVLTPFMTVSDVLDLSTDGKDLRDWTIKALEVIENVVPLSAESKATLLAAGRS